MPIPWEPHGPGSEVVMLLLRHSGGRPLARTRFRQPTGQGGSMVPNCPCELKCILNARLPSFVL